MILVRMFAAAAEAAGTDTVTLEEAALAADNAGDRAGAATLGGLRSELATRYGVEFERVLRRCAVLVDGARLGDDDPVPAAATVDVLPPFAGG